MKLTPLDRENITLEYEKLLNIPTQISPCQFILAPVGLVGSGKSTVVKQLSKTFSLIRISSDEIREILKNKLYDYKQDDVLYIGKQLLKKYLSIGYGVTFDSNCENKRDILTALEAEFNVSTIWIHINPPEEFILEKLKNMHYEKGRVFKDAHQAIETYFKDKPIYRNLDMSFIAEIDTSKNDLSPQIREVEEKIKKTLSQYL